MFKNHFFTAAFFITFFAGVFFFEVTDLLTFFEEGDFFVPGLSCFEATFLVATFTVFLGADFLVVVIFCIVDFTVSITPFLPAIIPPASFPIVAPIE